jgi:outer membrane protein assembly factor BamB
VTQLARYGVRPARRPRGARRRLTAGAVGLACLLLVAACDTTEPAAQFHTPDATATTPAAPFDGWSDPAGVGKPYGSTVTGLFTFRGNLTRTYYGEGPVPRKAPVEAWRYPRSGAMCGNSSDENGTRVWCGTGFTGEPAIFERDGRTWVVFGAYDYSVHFLDANTGEQIIPDFKTGDIIKGGVTIDPDGFPLVYTGSRDNYFRIISFDQGKPVELWKLSAYSDSPVYWNNDWDASALIIDDYLFEGGENSWFHIVKLNRGYDSKGHVTVKPKVVFTMPGWDSQLKKDFGSTQFSIEGGATIYKNTLYFSNSAGLVQGWDISGVKQGVAPKRIFRFWTGDDTDASVVVDQDGYLYVGSQYEKHNARSKQIGQMMKLDPSKPDDPLVWSQKDQAASGRSGVWGTPALYQDIVIYDLTGGDVVGLDRQTGEQRWRFHTPGGETWESPVVVDGVLVIGDCTGHLHGYDVSDTHAAPKELWTIKAGGCLESTPAVWHGKIYVGTRAGAFLALQEPK